MDELRSWTLFWYANRLTYCNQDPNLHDTPYRRDVTRAPIIFRGRPANRYSREWGHIVILPGADTAVFRNVEFVNFRKIQVLRILQNFITQIN